MKILAALDGSMLAESILPLLSALASRRETRITLVRVTEKLFSERYSLPENIAADLQRRLLGTSAEYLSGVRDRLYLPELDSLCLVGSAARELCREAREDSYDLIVVSANGRTGALHSLGSVADGIVRISTCPVLVVRPPVASCEFRHILIPVDGSAASLAVVQKLKPYRDSHTRITLVAATGLALEQTVDKIARSAWQTYTQRLEDNLMKVRLPGVRLEVEVVDGETNQSILHWATAAGCDLIAMASHGSEGSRDRHLLGSLTQTLLRQAPCSVLVFPPQPESIGLAPRFKWSLASLLSGILQGAKSLPDGTCHL